MALLLFITLMKMKPSFRDITNINNLPFCDSYNVLNSYLKKDGNSISKTSNLIFHIWSELTRFKILTSISRKAII